MCKVRPVHPGEMLEEEFLKPMGLSKYHFAREIALPTPRIGEIVAGNRLITADTGLCLGQFFGLGDGWWLALQARYDLVMTREKIAEKLAHIHPYAPQMDNA